MTQTGIITIVIDRKNDPQGYALTWSIGGDNYSYAQQVSMLLMQSRLSCFVVGIKFNISIQTLNILVNGYPQSLALAGRKVISE